MRAESGFTGIRMMRRFRFWIIAVLLISVMPVALTGCFGRFPLTHRIYNLNQNVSEHKFVRTLVFWLFVIVPVYEIGILADAIIFNLVEYWTGQRWIAYEPMEDRFGNIVTLEPSEDGNELVMTMTRNGEVIAQDRFIKVSDSKFEIRDAEGSLNGLVIVTPEGDIQIAKADGEVFRTIEADSIAGR